MNSRIVALVLALSAPLPASADLIAIEDNRFTEAILNGTVNRTKSPGEPVWSTEFVPGSEYGDKQESAFSPTAISGTGSTRLGLDHLTYQTFKSTFDMTFRVDRPTFAFLSGRFRALPVDVGFYSVTASLRLEENSSLLLTSPKPGDPAFEIPFSIQTTLMPGPVYRLFVEGSVSENYIGTEDTEILQEWSFALEVPEPPAIATLLIALGFVALASRQCVDPLD